MPNPFIPNLFILISFTIAVNPLDRIERGAELYVFLCSVSDRRPRKMQEDVFKQEDLFILSS